MEKTKAKVNLRIINTLLLHSGFIDNLGLLNGKMGISIFFYQPCPGKLEIQFMKITLGN
ncbi:MAG: hypothetical protein AB2L24_02435 [Mangrovibacterium sp.]